MIEIIGLHKRYRSDHGVGPWILRDINLVFPAGISVGIVGRNGAGKSTLLRLIGGADQPDKGQVIRRGSVSWPLGLSGGMQGSLTGRQNAKFVCRLYGHNPLVVQDKVEFIKDFSELGQYFEQPVKTYSSGMQSRLKFAMSMAFSFDVYLSDELTSVGDAAFRTKASAAFKGLAKNSSVIMVSHSDGTLKQFCQAGVWVHDAGAEWFDDINDALAAYNSSIKK